MSEESQLKVFTKILSFVNEYKTAFPNESIALYYKLLKKTQVSNTNAINKHIEVFDLTASIDCWGPESEYVRHGLDLNKFENRLAWAAQQGDWLRIHINQTITAMTMRTMADLIKKISQYSDQKHIGHYFQFCTGPYMFQHPQSYSYDFWADTFDEIYSAMPRRTESQIEAIPRMRGLQAQLQQFTQHNYKDIKKLHVYLDEIDRRRGTSWRELFSYLDIHE
jgi:hypothetical protein